MTAVLLVVTNQGIAAERHLDETNRYPARDGKRLLVEVGNVDVAVRAADVVDLEVHTDLRIAGVGERKADRWIALHTPIINDGDGELRISSDPGGVGFLGLGVFTARARLEVIAPIRVVPDLTTRNGAIDVRGDFPSAAPLRLRTADGTMTFAGATASLDIRSTGGDARLDVYRALDRLFFRTSSGSIELVGGARRAEVDTASGPVSLSNLSGPALVTTSTGRISLGWDRLEAEAAVTVRSQSGAIEIRLPAGVRPRGTLSSTTGAISCPLTGEWGPQGGVYHLSGDGPTLEVETASADITVTTAGP